MSIELTYRGRAVSGKNQQKTAMVRGRLIRFPNKNFKAWRADFQEQVFRQLAERAHLRAPVFTKERLVRLQVDYWAPDRLRRDATGILDALFHASELKNGGVLVVDDAQFKQVVFTERGVDRDNPRMQIWLEEYVQSSSSHRAAAGCAQ